MAGDNDKRFVSWQALAGFLIVILIGMIGNYIAITNALGTALEKKVDKELYKSTIESICASNAALNLRVGNANERARRMEILVDRIATRLSISTYVIGLPAQKDAE